MTAAEAKHLSERIEQIETRVEIIGELVESMHDEDGGHRVRLLVRDVLGGLCTLIEDLDRQAAGGEKVLQ